MKYEGLMKYAMIALALTAAVLAACNSNPNYGNPTTAIATATPSPNPALGVPINITVSADYVTVTPTPNPSPSATATPIAGGLVTFTFLPLQTPRLTATIIASEPNYPGPLTLSGCASPSPVTVVPKPGNAPQTTPVLYTATQVSSGSCTISVTDGIGHTTQIQLTVP